ncbi:sensor histidine kinase [sulfur-oxidizing endosymbiont of Gigantopelta aegis]|uniref:sensor histidine kinase n=1 Tax=sulfur-oxidizing endosymbiont of Gigantopelta aegis TaxID=2794934 RepID=UPI001BE4BFC4|nr:HAMP domain-containing sensor histidine kinase [sulfur-oxidizing endosymbiont of Gigantopelta aegis]
MVIFSQPVILLIYIIILFSCVAFCWYLLSSITSRLIKNELELEQSYLDMIRLDEEKTQATLRSTHELKAPLAAIKNYVYTMNAGYAGDINDKVLKIINRIGRRCDYLLNNVTDIIKLGNLKSYVVLDASNDNEKKAQFYLIDIEKYIDDFIVNNQNLTCEKNIKIIFTNQLSTEGISEGKCILANEENLQLIFTNLLSNAINYSYINGEIHIILNEKQEQNQTTFCITIEDRGIGIDENKINKIFDEHYRTNNAAQFYEGGTGLGLSIVKVCSQILGAELQLKSTLNQGTSVTICFKEGKISYE